MTNDGESSFSIDVLLKKKQTAELSSRTRNLIIHLDVLEERAEEHIYDKILDCKIWSFNLECRGTKNDLRRLSYEQNNKLVKKVFIRLTALSMEFWGNFDESLMQNLFNFNLFTKPKLTYGTNRSKNCVVSNGWAVPSTVLELVLTFLQRKRIESH